MSGPSIQPPAAASGTPPSARATRTRRIISLILSCAAIAGAATVLCFDAFDPRFISFDGMFEGDPFAALVRDSTPYWVIPAVASLILLSGLPRPTAPWERSPRILGISGTILSVLCILIPTAVTIILIGSFLLAPVVMLFQ